MSLRTLNYQLWLLGLICRPEKVEAAAGPGFAASLGLLG